MIAESIAKGFNGFDLELAWEAVFKDATVPPDDDTTTMYADREEGTGCEARAGLTLEKDLGWVAATLTSEAASRTLEYAYDDFCVASIAELTGHGDQAAFFFNRSKNYANIYNNATGLMEAKFDDGSWCSEGGTFTEANALTYTFNVWHDFPGLRNLLGGSSRFEEKLDDYFGGHHNWHGNEPSHATAFAYLYVNAPSKTQKAVRDIMRNNYFNNPFGNVLSISSPLTYSLAITRRTFQCLIHRFNCLYVLNIN
jgi:putative alpha-1,2-mannosidase